MTPASTADRLFDRAVIDEARTGTTTVDLAANRPRWLTSLRVQAARYRDTVAGLSTEPPTPDTRAHIRHNQRIVTLLKARIKTIESMEGGAPEPHGVDAAKSVDDYRDLAIELTKMIAGDLDGIYEDVPEDLHDALDDVIGGACLDLLRAGVVRHVALDQTRN